MKYTIEIVPDEYPESPRTWDNLGTIFAPHRNYDIGDKDAEDTREMSPDELKELIMLPVYIYEHGGIALSCGSFACSWDSGQLGVIYVSKAKVREEYGWKYITAKRQAKIEECLKGEIETYNTFVSGGVVAYVITDKNGNHIDSVHGYYSDEDAQTEAEGMVSWHKAEDKKAKAVKKAAKAKRKSEAKYYTDQFNDISVDLGNTYFPVVKIQGTGDTERTNWMDMNTDCIYALKKFIKRIEKFNAQKSEPCEQS